MTTRKLQQYLDAPTRNKIVFCRALVPGLSFIDIGKELSKFIQQSDFAVYDAPAFLQQLLGNAQRSEDGHQYIAINNIGILFEPELKINFQIFLDEFSVNNLLVVCSDAIVKNDKFYYPDDNGIIVNLQGLSFNII
ncbi:MAG: hypothetical protein MJZ41_12825 [Bacteroidaceae bacterium]|nr:hypothetical protein [Bacteroidaceae bacterium]